MAHGEDFTSGDGKNGELIYREKIADENFNQSKFIPISIYP